MGLPGAGKSTLAADLVGRGYDRLNRDERGGRLADLVGALADGLAAGRRRVVLDNTYGSRASRKRGDFARIDAVAFRRRPREGHDRRALIFWYDGVVRTSRAGARTPTSPDDVELLPGRREAIRRHLDDGWLVLGVSWQPEIERGAMTPGDVGATFARTHELLGADIDYVWCPHGEGPAVCWCRKPLPGLAVVLIERHRLDPARCVYVGRDASDEAFAHTAGFTYRHGDGVFGSSLVALSHGALDSRAARAVVSPPPRPGTWRVRS